MTIIVSIFVRKVLFGSMLVNSFNYPAERASSPPPYLLHHTDDFTATPSGDICCLLPDKGNVHEIKAAQ